MVRQVRALSISEDARLWLSQARRPRVLNSFERAWTLVDDRKRVLSIVTPAIGNGPVSIVVPDARLPALPETATIHCTLDRLETPTLIIDTASTAQWDATLPLNIPKVADMIYCGRHVLRHSADSLAQPYLNLPPPAAAFERIMMRRLTHATQALNSSAGTQRCAHHSGLSTCRAGFRVDTLRGRLAAGRHRRSALPGQ